MEEEENPGLAAIRDAVELYVQHYGYDQPTVVRDIVVVFETMQVADSGAMAHGINYTIPMEGTSMAASIGLCRIGEVMISADLRSLEG